MKVRLLVVLFCGLLVGAAGAEEAKETQRTSDTQATTVTQAVCLTSETQLTTATKTVALTSGTQLTSVTKTVYLTFDDGPSEYTGRVLDTLKKYNVPATFFVCGNKSAEGIGLFKRMIAQGEAIGNHSFSHNAKNYKNVDDFMKDLNKQDDSLSSSTGLHTRIMRFPYGSNTTQVSQAQMRAVITAVVKAGYSYFDWTADAQDWKPGATKETVLKNIIHDTKADNRNFAIVLMHDTKKHSMEALPSIIEFFQKEGYRFEKLSPQSDTRRFTTIN